MFIYVRLAGMPKGSGKRTRRRGRKPKPKLKRQDIRGSKHVKLIIDLLKPLRAHRDCPNRRLHYDELVAYLLLYFFTPALDSMRGIQQMSNLEAVKKKLGLRRFSLGSFSEASHVFDPSLLEPIIEELTCRLEDVGADERLRALEVAPMLVDGTLLHALPRMAWALWLRHSEHAAKMHLEYDLLKSAPVHATLTHGNGDERRELRKSLRAGIPPKEPEEAPERRAKARRRGAKLYVLDRGFADYGLMSEILTTGNSFLVRINQNAVYEVLEQLEIAPEAAKAGVVRDEIVRLGCEASPQLHDRRIRVVQVHVEDESARLGLPRQYRRKRVSSDKTHRSDKSEYTLLLATDQLELDALLVCQLYRYRWQIELFFRWFKKVLEADYVLCESENGMTILMYCALIASILVRLWTGRKPTKRTFEMLSFFFSGWASERELIAHIDSLKEADGEAKGNN